MMFMTSSVVDMQPMLIKWARPDSNRGPPPCEGGVLTRLDDEPIHIQTEPRYISFCRAAPRTRESAKTGVRLSVSPSLQDKERDD
jgi:hypothetical protein